VYTIPGVAVYDCSFSGYTIAIFSKVTNFTHFRSDISPSVSTRIAKPRIQSPIGIEVHAGVKTEVEIGVDILKFRY
jgi:hypothetical protein